MDDAKLKRAGLDYWPYPKVSVLFVVSFYEFSLLELIFLSHKKMYL